MGPNKMFSNILQVIRELRVLSLISHNLLVGEVELSITTTLGASKRFYHHTTTLLIKKISAATLRKIRPLYQVALLG